MITPLAPHGNRATRPIVTAFYPMVDHPAPSARWRMRIGYVAGGTAFHNGGHMSVDIELEQAQDQWTLTVAGELDYSECSTFRMHIDRVLKSSPPALIVDMSGIEYLDSSGLGLLLSLSREFTPHGGRLVLITNPTVDSILELTRLTGIFSIAGNAEEAAAIVAHTASPASCPARVGAGPAPAYPTGRAA